MTRHDASMSPSHTRMVAVIDVDGVVADVWHRLRHVTEGEHTTLREAQERDGRT